MMLRTSFIRAVATAATWITLAGGLVGCTSLLPAHANSEDADGESVTIEFLDAEGLSGAAASYGPSISWNKSEWETCRLRTPEPADRGVLPLGAALPLIAGAVSSAIRAEQEKYTAQFEADTATTDAMPFWEQASGDTGALQQRIAGFRVRRFTSRAPESVPGQPAFDLLCELRGVAASGKSAAEGRLKVVPVAMITRHAKAKVLHLNWTEPWAVLWMWAFQSSDTLNSSIQVCIDGTWDGKLISKDETDSKKTIESPVPSTNVALGVVEFQQSQYSIADPKVLAPKGPTKMVKIPLEYKQPSANALTLAIKVVVTEQDASNATKYLKFLEERVDKYASK